MSARFADTFYYLAVLSPEDEAHERAIALSRELRGSQITTAWVLTEVADALAAPKQRGAFLSLLRRLEANRRVTIVPPTEELFAQAVRLYADRPDKEWSLTDCVSFVVMEERGIESALTADRHFQQAGFRILF